MFQQLEIFVEGLLNTCAGAGAWGYVIIGLLIAVENIFPPIPSEVILGLGGALTAARLFRGLPFCRLPPELISVRLFYTLSDVFLMRRGLSGLLTAKQAEC